MKRMPRSLLTAKYTLMQTFFNLSLCCSFNYASIFLLSRSLNNGEIGLVFSIANGLSLLCQPFLASFADRNPQFPLRNLLAMAISLSVLCSICLNFVPTLPLVTALLYILLSAAMSTQTSLLNAMAMEHINSGIPLNFSLARGIGSAAFALLTLVMGFLVNDFGPAIIPYSITLISILYLLLSLGFPRPAAPVKKERAEAVGLLRFVKGNRRFMLVVLSAICIYFSHILYNTFTFQIIRHVGGDSAEMGIASALAAFLELPAMALVPLVMRKFSSAGWILKLSAVFFTLKALVTFLAKDIPTIYLSQLLQFFAFAVYIPAAVYYTNEVVAKADQVKGQACMGMAVTISGMVGSTLGGFVLDQFGVSAMLGMGTAVSALGCVLLFFVMRRPIQPAPSMNRSVKPKSFTPKPSTEAAAPRQRS